MLHEFRNTTTILHPILHIYAKFSDATAFRGGSIKKSKELKTIMKMVKKISDLQGSAYRLTSVIPSSWPVLEDASSNWSVGHVKKPYAVPVRAAPKCVLQQPIHKWVLKFKSHISFHYCMFILSFLLPIHDEHVFSYPITIRTESFYIEEISNDQLEKYIHKIMYPRFYWLKPYQSSIGPKLLNAKPRSVIIIAFWNILSETSFAITSLFWTW